MKMETNDLITLLSQAPQPERPLRLGMLAFAVAVLSALATMATIGVRPELGAGQPPDSFWVKTLALAAMALVSLRELERSSKPVVRQGRPWVAWALAVAMATLVIHEWATVEAATILKGLVSRNFVMCLAAVSVYGGLGMLGFAALMRFYAPVDVKKCAGYVGLSAAAAAAVGYSIHCPLDSPTFIVVAYGLVMVALWGIGRVVLPKKLNW